MILIIFCIVILFHCTSAWAVCLTASLSGLPSTVTFQGGSGEYEVFDPNEYIQTVNFQVNADILTLPCDFFITLSEGQSGDFNQRELSQGGNTLNYNAYVDSGKSNILKDLPTATDNEIIAGNFPLGLGQSQDVSFFWTVDPSQVVPATASRYTDTNLTLSLYTGVLGVSELLVDTANITFQARAESSVDLSLADSGGSFDIGDTTQTLNFGTLESSEELSFDVVVRSNDGYRVTLQSSNNQELVHENAPTITDTINYGIEFDGSSIDLSSGLDVEAIADTGLTTANGLSFSTKVTIGTLSGSETAGNYSDVITATVTAN